MSASKGLGLGLKKGRILIILRVYDVGFQAVGESVRITIGVPGLGFKGYA